MKRGRLQDDQRRILGRWLAFGGPCLTAAITAGGFMLPEPVGPALAASPYEDPFVMTAIGVSILCGGAGAWLICRDDSEQVWKIPFLAIVAVLIYSLALAFLTLPYNIQRQREALKATPAVGGRSEGV